MVENNTSLLSIKDAARYLGVSYKTVYRMVVHHQLEAQRVGNQWRIQREALHKDIASGKTEKR